MNYPKLAILIPIYKFKPDPMEIFALKRMTQIFCERKLFFVAPMKLDASWYENNFEKIEIERFDDNYFLSLHTYNKLMLSVSFYEHWLKLGFESILICQLDVYVISDRLNEFLNMPYDYIGAPLIRLENDSPRLYCGNGGFSLRRLRPFINALKNHADMLKTWKDNEDEFFSYLGDRFPKEFRAAPPRIALQFSFDRFNRFLYKINRGNLPMAIHGWLSVDPKFSLQILGLDEKSFSEVKDIRKTEEEKCLVFAQSHQPIILYGVGLWGKVFCRYLKKNHVSVQCFAVSNGERIDSSYNGVLIKHLSDIPEENLSNGVMFSLSKRYLGEDVFYKIYKSVVNYGFKHCFECNMVLYNIAVESWLEEKG